jgi:hypothetical protein
VIATTIRRLAASLISLACRYVQPTPSCARE